MKYFGHSGDLGDIIYALPTIKAAGGGTLYLINQPARTTFPMTKERVQNIRSLLLQQPYIHAVVFADNDTSHDSSINGFRDHCCHGRNLADAHLSTHGYAFSHRNRAWLQVDFSEIRNPVIFARSGRYHNERFPWRQVADNYRRDAAFLGTEQEHQEFVAQFGFVPHLKTGNLLEAARIIAGCRLFVGNQSCLFAIAEGLKKNVLLEVFPDLPNCIFDRMGAVHAWNENFEMPLLPYAEPTSQEVTKFSAVDDAVCINLARRAERWRLFKFRVREVGLDIFRRHEATDGNYLDLPEEIKSHRGTYGCLHSHANVYREALQKGYKQVLVVEDDCVFTGDVNKIAEYIKAAKGEYSWIHLGGARGCYPRFVSRGTMLFHVSSVLNTHAYIIDDRLMRLYVRFVDENPFPCDALMHSDRLLMELCNRNKLKICVPLTPFAQQDKLLPADVQWGVPIPEKGLELLTNNTGNKDHDVRPPIKTEIVDSMPHKKATGDAQPSLAEDKAVQTTHKLPTHTE